MRRPGSASALALLVLALLVAAPPAATAAELEPVPAARPAEASRISAAALASVAALQRDDGRFSDPTGRVVGSSGLPTLAWAALHADGEGAAERLALARRTLARGSGATVILRWPLAMAVADGLAELPADDRSELRGRVASWATLKAAGIADRCYRRSDCFNNYKLVDAVLNLELARSGVHSDQPGTRLQDPAALRRRALGWLDSALPAVAPPTATVAIPGRRTEQATVLSDPGALPLAYHALCTAWAVRAVRLAGPQASPKLRLAARRALWGLVGLTAPDGEVSWSGRGQDQAWTLAAALYAGAAGSALLRGWTTTTPSSAARGWRRRSWSSRATSCPTPPPLASPSPPSSTARPSRTRCAPGCSPGAPAARGSACGCAATTPSIRARTSGWSGRYAATQTAGTRSARPAPRRSRAAAVRRSASRAPARCCSPADARCGRARRPGAPCAAASS